MIPSDHFVKFYNEVFKFLDKCGNGELEKYYGLVSSNQEFHCLELFRQKGLAGMYEYWDHIRIEENCDMELFLDAECFHCRMKICPSLSKITDNDGGGCSRYCEHCPGWILPLMTKAGFFAVYNMIDRQKPECEFFIYQDKSPAERKAGDLRKRNAADVIRCNFQ